MGKQRAARAASRWEQQQKQSQNRRQRRMEEQEEIRLQAAVRSVVGPTPDLTYQNLRSGMQLFADNVQRAVEAVQSYGQSTSAFQQILDAANNLQPPSSLLSTLADSMVNQSRASRPRRPVEPEIRPVYMQESVSISQSYWDYARSLYQGRMPEPDPEPVNYLSSSNSFRWIDGCNCPSCTYARNNAEQSMNRDYSRRQLLNSGLSALEVDALYQGRRIERPYLDYSKQALIIPGGREITFEAMSRLDVESPEFKRWLFLNVPIQLKQEVNYIVSQYQVRNRPRGRNAATSYVDPAFLSVGQSQEPLVPSVFDQGFSRIITGGLMVPNPVLQQQEPPRISAYEGMMEVFNQVQQIAPSRPKPPEEIDQMRAKVARAQKLLQDTSGLLSRVVAGLEVTPEEARALKARVDAGVEAFK